MAFNTNKIQIEAENQAKLTKRAEEMVKTRRELKERKKERKKKDKIIMTEVIKATKKNSKTK